MRTHGIVVDQNTGIATETIPVSFDIVARGENLLVVDRADALLDSVTSAGATSTRLRTGDHHLSNIPASKSSKGAWSESIVRRSDRRGGEGEEGEDSGGEHVER
jgi:hypothetical protein